VAAGRADFAGERLGREREQPLGLDVGHRPDHRHVLARQRQQGEYRAAAEPLESRAAMRPLAGEIGDHRPLAVGAAAHRDPGLLAHRRARAVRPGHELRAQRAAAGQLQARRVPAVELQPGEAIRDQSLHGIVLRERFVERGLQRAVFRDPGQGGDTRAVGIERELGAAVVAEHAHGAHRGDAIARQALPCAQPGEEFDVSRRHGVHAGVESRARGHRRGSLADQCHRQAARRARQRQPRQPGADDRQVNLHARILAAAPMAPGRWLD
jgi:hypothetical protein